MAYQTEWGAAVGDISGNPDWITPLLLRYEGPLLKYAQRLMHCPDRARDVVQETFLRLCREPAIARESHIAEWLFTVCRNYALDVKRKEQRMIPVASAELGNTQSPQLLPDQQAAHHETANRVLELVQDLPQNQQSVLMLKFQGSLSYKEIAGVTGLSVSNVGYLIHQGLTTLRRLLKNEL
jgi:RNA polymerase sigma-70 factor (ECF subfamily)